MVVLNEQQIARIDQALNKHNISHHLREELLDHLCCSVERRMSEGMAFDTAVEQVLAVWRPARTRKINRQIFFRTKLKSMLLKTAIMALLVVTGTTFTGLPAPANPSVVVTPPAFVCENVLLTFAEPSFDPPAASPLAGVELDEAHSKFGKRRHPIDGKIRWHMGIDFRAKPGTFVLVTAPGKVTFAGPNGKNGIQVRVAHGDNYETVYSHLQSADVSVGQQVQLGEVIAKVGSSGQSTGPHLHYEVRKGDRAVDPLAMLK